MYLKEWLFKNDLDVKHLAEILGVSYGVALYITNETRKVSLLNALKIYKYTLGEVTLEELLFEDDYYSLVEVKNYKKQPTEDFGVKKKIRL